MSSHPATHQNSTVMFAMSLGWLDFLLSDFAGASDLPNAAPSEKRAASPYVVALPRPPEPAAMAPSAIIMNHRAAVRIDGEIVKFFFPSGKSDIAKDAPKALEKVISGMQSGQNVKISGFHDNLGDAEFIPELVKQRTIAVKNTLMQLGIPEVQIQLSEPEITAATSSNAQARRVEVTLID